MKPATVAFALLVALSTGASAADQRDEAWEATRGRIESELQAGRIAAAEAYDQLRQRYDEIV